MGKCGRKKDQTILQHTKTPTKTPEKKECQKMLREKVRNLEKEIISLKSKKKKTTLHTLLWSKQHKDKETIVATWKNTREDSP